MERCGKINASNSGSESWTGIGVVAGFRAVVLIRQWPHRRNREVTWCSELLQILQKVRGNGKTRNHLNVNNGMSIADLQKVLGHKKKETTLKYIHAVNTSLRETMLKTQA